MKYNSSFLFYSLLLLLLLVHDLFFWTWGFVILPIRLCHAVQSLEPCTLYIHMKGFSIFCSPWQVCISQIFFSLLATIVVIFFFCVFCHISVALFKPKDMLAILPQKITASWNAKKIIKSDALLQISSHAPSGESLSDFASVFLKLSYHLLWH